MSASLGRPASELPVRPSRGRRLIVQYLEPSPELDDVNPSLAAEKLDEALAVAPITDVCLGWGLPGPLAESVAQVARGRATLWRWQPVFSGDGAGERIAEDDLCLGPSGSPPSAFGGLDAFRFSCPNRPGVVDRAVERVVATASELPVEGVLLDRIRWPSPAAASVEDLACFCDHCHLLAMDDGLDLVAVAQELRRLEETLAGRRRMVVALPGWRRSGLVGRFLSWREAQMSRALLAVESAISGRGVSSIALDVFTPVLARTVGQTIAGLAREAPYVDDAARRDRRRLRAAALRS